MARDENFSLAVLQGVGPSQVGLYPPSVLGRWPPLHTLDEAALRHSRRGRRRSPFSEITQAVQRNNRAWLNQSISMNQVCTISNQARIM